MRTLELPTIRTKHLDCIVHSTLASVHAALIGRYDLVHFHGIGPSLTCWLLRAGPARVVATVHRQDYRARKWARFAQTALRIGEHLALAVPERTLAVSHALVDNYARRGKPCTYLPSGVEIRPRLPPEVIFRAYGLSGEDFLLSMGRWTIDKQLTHLVASFLAADTGNMKLVVAGESDPGSAYSRRVRAAAGNSDRILFPGVVGGRLKEELLSNTFGFVSASTTEGLPIVILEAMSYARVCVVSGIVAHREIITDGETGIIVPGEDGPTLSRQLERLARIDGPERAAMGRRARRFVAASHDWERVVDQLEEIYREVVGE